MSTLLLTIAIACVIAVLAMALLGIGWLMTGRSKIYPGACGRDPTKKREEGCGTGKSCSLCDRDEE